MEKKTPLYDKHVSLGGKIVPFAGYLLPVQYGMGLIAEHTAVRTKAGLFDVSHMAELVLTGKDAYRTVNELVCATLDGMTIGQVRYSPMCNDGGGIVDDLMVYKKGEEEYLLVVNAANHEKDAAWVSGHLLGDTVMTDISEDTAQIAIQGPLAQQILSAFVSEADIPEKYYTFLDARDMRLPSGTVKALISRTGYTGEAGFEIYCDSKDASAVWDALLEEGAPMGLIPCGLGARDTLRLEAAMPLYGHEMNDEISPRETGLGIFCKLEKPSFIGRDAIAARGKATVKRVGLKVTGRGVIREHLDIYAGDEKIGHVTSGTMSPTLGYSIGMAILPKSFAEPGTALEVDVRGRRVPCEVVKLPFYKKA